MACYMAPLEGEDTGVEEDAVAALLNKPCVLQTEVLKFEASVIRQALAKANGSLIARGRNVVDELSGAGLHSGVEAHRVTQGRSPIRRRSRTGDGGCRELLNS